jgi:hypothetical protein
MADEQKKSKGNTPSPDSRAEVLGVFFTQEVRNVGTGTTTRKPCRKSSGLRNGCALRHSRRSPLQINPRRFRLFPNRHRQAN